MQLLAGSPYSVSPSRTNRPATRAMVIVSVRLASAAMVESRYCTWFLVVFWPHGGTRDVNLTQVLGGVNTKITRGSKYSWELRKWARADVIGTATGDKGYQHGITICLADFTTPDDLHQCHSTAVVDLRDGVPQGIVQPFDDGDYWSHVYLSVGGSK